MKFPAVDSVSAGDEETVIVSRSTKSDPQENPFRKEMRRMSIPSVTNNRRQSLPTAIERRSSFDLTTERKSSFENINERRHSLTKKNSTIDLSKSEEIMRNIQSKQKRNSLTSMQRPSLRSVGAKVSNMIRAKNVLNRFRTKIKPKEDLVSEEAFEIKEMPKEPRFASTLSAEAQYATMKGYEDVVYQNLCQMYPENLPAIRRNKTPMPGARIKIVDKKQPVKLKTATNGMMTFRNIFKKQTEETKIVANDAPAPLSSSSSSPPPPVSKDDQQPPKRPHASPRSIQVAPAQTPLAQTTTTTTAPPTAAATGKTTTTNTSSTTTNATSNTTSNTTSSSTTAVNIPYISPAMEKQLILTYRYQRAMDLLDILRRNQGSYPLSPRKSINDKVEPLKEYNNWAYVWTHHFENKSAQDTR